MARHGMASASHSGSAVCGTPVVAETTGIVFDNAGIDPKRSSGGAADCVILAIQPDRPLATLAFGTAGVNLGLINWGEGLASLQLTDGGNDDTAPSRDSKHPLRNP